MPVLSNMELRGLEKGKEIGKKIGKELGILEKAQSVVKTLLQARFGENYRARELESITDLLLLDRLLRLAATAKSGTAFQEGLTVALEQRSVLVAVLGISLG